MVWPNGFVKSHRKETLEYRSDGSLHNGKTPYISVKVTGGVLLDLQTAAIESQISQLLDVEELLPDEALCSLI